MVAKFLVIPRTELISARSADPILYAPPLTDAGITAYAGYKVLSQLRPRSTVAVISIRGLGAYIV